MAGIREGTYPQEEFVTFEDQLTEFVRATGPHAIWILFGAAMVEYLFPPFPGDTVTLIGAYYAVVGELRMPLVFLAVTLGGLAGSAIDYLIGLRLRQVSELGARANQIPFRWLSPKKLRSIEATWRKRGDLYILMNRFLPGIRGLFFVAAGMGQMPFRRVMFFGALSSALWNGLLLVVGYLVGANLERLESLFRTYSRIAWLCVGAGIFLYCLRWLFRRYRPKREEV